MCLYIYMNQLVHIPKDNINVLFNMATLRRPSKDKDIIIGRFKPNGSCKKHPKHRQSPGVCSLCLRDKLSQLSNASSSSRASSYSSFASSSLSSYYSSSASSCASPTVSFPFPTEAKGASNLVNTFLLSSKHAGVFKSRSMSVVATRKRRKEGEDGDSNKSGKKRGFWSKLLHPKSKKMEKIKGPKLVHTRSLIETMT